MFVIQVITMTDTLCCSICNRFGMLYQVCNHFMDSFYLTFIPLLNSIYWNVFLYNPVLVCRFLRVEKYFPPSTKKSARSLLRENVYCVISFAFLMTWHRHEFYLIFHDQLPQGLSPLPGQFGFTSVSLWNFQATSEKVPLSLSEKWL